VIVASGSTTVVVATIRPTTTIGATKAFPTSFSFSSMVTQQPSTKTKVLAL